jgi:hypothetical protein
MARGKSDVPSGEKLRLADWGIVAAVVAVFVALAVGIQVGAIGSLFAQLLQTQHSAHVTECGVDAKGPYAKLVGGEDRQGVTVGFTYDGHWYGWGRSTTIGSTATFVRGPWPPSVINLNWDGGPKNEGKIRVEGRVVGGHWVNTGMSLQSPQQAYPKFRRHFKAVVEPNDLSRLGCELNWGEGED